MSFRSASEALPGLRLRQWPSYHRAVSKLCYLEHLLRSAERRAEVVLDVPGKDLRRCSTVEGHSFPC